MLSISRPTSAKGRATESECNQILHKLRPWRSVDNLIMTNNRENENGFAEVKPFCDRLQDLIYSPILKIKILDSLHFRIGPKLKNNVISSYPIMCMSSRCHSLIT